MTFFILDQQGKSMSVVSPQNIIEYLFILILWPGARDIKVNKIERWSFSSWALYSRESYTTGSKMMPLLYDLFIYFYFLGKSDNCNRVFLRKKNHTL